MGHGGGHHGGGHHGGGHSHSHAHHNFRSGHRTTFHSTYRHGSGGGGSAEFPCTQKCLAPTAIVLNVVVFTGLIIAVPVLLFRSTACSTVDTLNPFEQAVCRPEYGKPVVTVSITPAADTSTYLFASRPKILPREVKVTREYYSSVQSDGYEYYSFALIEGSKMTFTLIADSTVTWSIMSSSSYKTKVAGQHPFTYWSRVASKVTGATFTVPSTDEWFVVADNYLLRSSATEWHFNMSLKQYNLTGAVDQCSDVEKCTFKGVGSLASIVSTYRGNSSPPKIKMTMKRSPALSIGVTAAVFGAAVLVIIAVVGVVVAKRKRKSTGDQQTTSTPITVLSTTPNAVPAAVATSQTYQTPIYGAPSAYEPPPATTAYPPQSPLTTLYGVPSAPATAYPPPPPNGMPSAPAYPDGMPPQYGQY